MTRGALRFRAGTTLPAVNAQDGVSRPQHNERIN